VGAALANRKHGRLSVSIQCDGDFNYSPAAIWTAAHHKIPILYVMHNNRAYHEERMYITMLGAKFNRGDGDRSDIGTALIQPDINYASIAKGYGLYAEGPIADPNDLAPALKRAIERVKAGEPALLDIHTQPR
jgi:thiamine pyrophosphate-dependent acetolactate synthase large subunit-like protein